MSHDVKIYRNGRAQGSDCDRRPGWQRKLIMETIVETKASSILQFLHGLRGELHVTWEEGTWAAWLYDLLQPQVQEVVVCNPRRNALLKEGSKSDKVDARKLADLLRPGMLRPVYHGEMDCGRCASWDAVITLSAKILTRSNESTEGAVSRLGHSLCRHPGLCSAVSGGMVEQDRASRGAPPRRAALSTTGWIADLAAKPATRVFGGEPET